MEVWLQLWSSLGTWSAVYFRNASLAGAFIGIFLVVLFLGIAIAIKYVKGKNKVLMIFCALSLPISMNIAYLLSGVTHALMEYSWLSCILLAFVLGRFVYRKSGVASASKVKTSVSCIAIIVLFVCIWNGVVNCNQLYLQRELQDNARLSYITRVLERLEDEDGFATNAKEIAIIGTSHGMRSGIASEYYMLGNEKVYYKYDTFMAYCAHVLDYDIPYCSTEKIYELSRDTTVEGLEAYPAKNCVAEIDGTYVIRVSD